jgi:hypothetical protein
VHSLHQQHEYENSQGEVVVIFVAIHRTEIDALQEEGVDLVRPAGSMMKCAGMVALVQIRAQVRLASALRKNPSLRRINSLAPQLLTVKTAVAHYVLIFWPYGKRGTFQAIIDVPVEWGFNTPAFLAVRLSLSSDGKSLATTVIRSTGDIWILDGFQSPPTLWQRLLRR